MQRAGDACVRTGGTGSVDMSDEVSGKIISMIASHLGVEPAAVKPETFVDELGIDSLKLTEIVMDVEDHFNIQIDLNTAEAWEKYRTVASLIEGVKDAIAANA